MGSLYSEWIAKLDLKNPWVDYGFWCHLPIHSEYSNPILFRWFFQWALILSLIVYVSSKLLCIGVTLGRTIYQTYQLQLWLQLLVALGCTFSTAKMFLIRIDLYSRYWENKLWAPTKTVVTYKYSVVQTQNLHLVHFFCHE